MWINLENFEPLTVDTAYVALFQQKGIFPYGVVVYIIDGEGGRWFAIDVDYDVSDIIQIQTKPLTNMKMTYHGMEDN